jgi:hypothetical protein
MKNGAEERTKSRQERRAGIREFIPPRHRP